MSFDSGIWLREVAENVERLTIEQLLGLHELVVGPLCPATKRRIVEAAVSPPALPNADAVALHPQHKGQREGRTRWRPPLQFPIAA